ncbi:hypothetical protein [Sphingobium sp. EP60837]|uniref:hypothetical protein n=1 Tax=Sphingobium sp. EP60837 TaxID=1855519 RepID=UPI0007DD1C3F|nr:hypothetical protein [Sphingobium sp. EP60837]ANI79188.1 hypothetical protein EP837_02794 [Sphingobium sp. EP60837]
MIVAFTSLVATSLAVHAATLSRPEGHSDDGLPISATPRQHVVAEGGDFSIREASRAPGVQQPDQRLTFKLGAHVALPLPAGSSASRTEAAHEVH